MEIHCQSTKTIRTAMGIHCQVHTGTHEKQNHNNKNKLPEHKNVTSSKIGNPLATHTGNRRHAMESIARAWRWVSI